MCVKYRKMEMHELMVDSHFSKQINVIIKTSPVEQLTRNVIHMVTLYIYFHWEVMFYWVYSFVCLSVCLSVIMITPKDMNRSESYISVRPEQREK